MIQVTKEFTFDAAHFVPNYYGKCERMHGHTYKLQVTVEGELGKNGMVVDFIFLKRIVEKRVLSKLDHYLLNDIVENATCENIAKWIWEQLADFKSLVEQELQDPTLPESVKKYLQDQSDGHLEFSDVSRQVRLKEVRLFETQTSWVSYWE